MVSAMFRVVLLTTLVLSPQHCWTAPVESHTEGIPSFDLDKISFSTPNSKDSESESLDKLFDIKDSDKDQKTASKPAQPKQRQPVLDSQYNQREITSREMMKYRNEEQTWRNNYRRMQMGTETSQHQGHMMPQTRPHNPQEQYDRQYGGEQTEYADDSGLFKEKYNYYEPYEHDMTAFPEIHMPDPFEQLSGEAQDFVVKLMHAYLMDKNPGFRELSKMNPPLAKSLTLSTLNQYYNQKGATTEALLNILYDLNPDGTKPTNSLGIGRFLIGIYNSFKPYAPLFMLGSRILSLG